MLSILIPTYNYAILALVKNVHQQCLKAQIPFEIICLDDQSDNDYQIENQVISTLPSCIYNVNQTNVGRTRTRQRLAEQAKYDWLLFLDADVIPVTSAFIQHYIDAIQPNTVIFGGYQYEKESTDATKILRYRYGKEREEKYVLDNFYTPLGMHTAGYLPRNRFTKAQIVPTEDDKVFRKTLLEGYVHDQGAALKGGVAGHAGLFGNANDLAIYYQMLLNKGEFNGHRILKQETVVAMTTINRLPEINSGGKGFQFGLGFELYNEVKKPVPEISNSAFAFL